MEHTSEYVEIGNLIHQSTYKKKRKEINLDGIKIDFYEKNKGVIHEVKKSKAIDNADHWQLKYYLWYLSNLGLSVTGSVDYPMLRRREIIELSDEDRIEIERMLDKINEILSLEQPPKVKEKPFCKKCSYYELCFI